MAIGTKHQFRIKMRKRKQYRPKNAAELEAALDALFPACDADAQPSDGDSIDRTFHSVMRDFAPRFRAEEASEAQLQQLALLLESCVSERDRLENAVSTCFLEHLHQVDRKRVLWRYLSKKVRQHAHA